MHIPLLEAKPTSDPSLQFNHISEMEQFIKKNELFLSHVKDHGYGNYPLVPKIRNGDCLLKLIPGRGILDKLFAHRTVFR